MNRRILDILVFAAVVAVVFSGIVLLAFALSCTPLPPPTPPDPPPSPVDSHCPESCERLQALGCKHGSDAVCAEFDDTTGECSRTHGCVEACREAPDAYPRDPIEECP